MDNTNNYKIAVKSLENELEKLIPIYDKKTSEFKHHKSINSISPLYSSFHRIVFSLNSLTIPNLAISSRKHTIVYAQIQNNKLFFKHYLLYWHNNSLLARNTDYYDKNVVTKISDIQWLNIINQLIYLSGEMIAGDDNQTITELLYHYNLVVIAHISHNMTDMVCLYAGFMSPRFRWTHSYLHQSQYYHILMLNLTQSAQFYYYTLDTCDPFLLNILLRIAHRKPLYKKYSSNIKQLEQFLYVLKHTYELTNHMVNLFDGRDDVLHFLHQHRIWQGAELMDKLAKDTQKLSKLSRSKTFKRLHELGVMMSSIKFKNELYQLTGNRCSVRKITPKKLKAVLEQKLDSSTDIDD